MLALILTHMTADQGKELGLFAGLPLLQLLLLLWLEEQLALQVFSTPQTLSMAFMDQFVTITSPRLRLMLFANNWGSLEQYHSIAVQAEALFLHTFHMTMSNAAEQRPLLMLAHI